MVKKNSPGDFIYEVSSERCSHKATRTAVFGTLRAPQRVKAERASLNPKWEEATFKQCENTLDIVNRIGHEANSKQTPQLQLFYRIWAITWVPSLSVAPPLLCSCRARRGWISGVLACGYHTDVCTYMQQIRRLTQPAESAEFPGF